MDDQMWCSLRGRSVPIMECHTGCVDETQREVCWMGKNMLTPTVVYGAVSTEPVLREVETRLTRARLIVNVELAREKWAASTAMVVDGHAEAAWTEGYVAGLREADRIFNEERRAAREP